MSAGTAVESRSGLRTPPDDAQSGRSLRLSIGLVSMVSLLAGSVGFALGWDAVRLLGMLVFFGLGIGSAPWQLNSRLGGYERLALTFVTGSAVLVLIPTSMSALRFWHPAVAFVLVAAVALPLHVLGVLQVRDEMSAAHRGGVGWTAVFRTLVPDRDAVAESASAWLPAVLTATFGALLCLAAALGHRHLDPGFYGFLPRIGPAWYVGLACILVSLVLKSHHEASRAIPVLLLVVVLTATPALTYDGPRSQSAAKHVDFVLQIQSLHFLDSSVSIYNAFPGFFEAMAWLTGAAGITDPMRLAVAWPVLLGLFRVVVLRYFAGRFLPRSEQAWVAVTLAVLVDSLGADYFSPQSLGFVLGIAAIAVSLTLNPSVPRVPVVLLAGVTLAVAHQLSPYATGGALVVLVVFSMIRPWWVPGLVLGPAAIWTMLHWGAVKGYVSLSSLGQFANFHPPETAGSAHLQRLPVVENTVLAVIGGVGIVGGLGLVTLILNRTDPLPWALACCSAVGFMIVAIQPYGQEGIFRAALFGLPWLAVLAAPAVAGYGRNQRAGLLVTSVLLSATFLVSSFGLDALGVIRPSDLAAVRQFEALGGTRPPRAYYLLLLNTGDQPTTPEPNGSRHFIWSREVIDEPVQQEVPFHPEREVRALTDRFRRYATASSTAPHLYALWSPVGARYGAAYAVESEHQAVALRDAFRDSPYWTVTSRADGTYLFRFTPARYPGARG